MKTKILLIVEGEKTEPNILGSASHGLLSLIGADYEIVPFANPIYELYDAYINNEYDDLVSYLRVEKGLKIDDNVLSKNAFSAIYLIFDYEPQDHKYSDKKILDLLRIFNNETELGKLYINYPMVEAYYHLESLPDDKYNARMISLNGLNGKKYKKIVNLSTCLRKNKISNKDLCFIIMHNYNKCHFITNKKSDNINYESVLEEQIKQKNGDNKIYVLSTFALMPFDYNFEKTMSILKLKLKDNYIQIENNEKSGSLSNSVGRPKN